jgi:hypothetical protein
MTDFWFNGLRVIPSPHMLGNPVVDYSGCRSRARAERRAKQGHKQRTVVRYVPDNNVIIDRKRGVIYAHPDVVAKLKERG